MDAPVTIAMGSIQSFIVFFISIDSSTTLGMTVVKLELSNYSS